jgi:hypothetical protein
MTNAVGAQAVVQRAIASLPSRWGFEVGYGISYSMSEIVLQNKGGILTRLTATGGITVMDAQGNVLLQLGL